MQHLPSSGTRSVRRQLSLYVPERFAAGFEAVRRIVDPVQRRLIPAHVTLCREDEIARFSAAELDERLSQAGLAPITLRFSHAQVFDGHGILLNCVAGHSEFQALRERVLGSAAIRVPQPHITLAHPRNPRAPGNSLAAVAAVSGGLTIPFDAISRIEQVGQGPWRRRRTFPLVG